MNPPEAQQPGAQARPRPGRRWALRVGLLLLSLTLALIVVEAGVRRFDPFGVSYYKDVNRYFNEAIAIAPDVHPESRIFEHRPGLSLEFKRFTLETDELGLRTGPTARPNAEAGEALRVLFLGDSVTLAWGVDDADSWPRLVEARELAADGRPVRSLNAGHLQYNSLQEADWFAQHAAELAPDAVVLTFVVNDLDDAYVVYEELVAALAADQGAEPGFGRRLLVRLRQWFRGLDQLRHFREERQRAVPAEDRNVARVEDAPGYAEGWRRCELGLDRVLARCRELGVPLVVLDHSMPPVPALRGWGAERGVPVHAFTFDDEEWLRDIRNSEADAHANELGNRLLAEKARVALTQNGWLTPRAASDP